MFPLNPFTTPSPSEMCNISFLELLKPFDLLWLDLCKCIVKNVLLIDVWSSGVQLIAKKDCCDLLIKGYFYMYLLCWILKKPFQDVDCCWMRISLVSIQQVTQGAKKIIFTACHSGKLKLAFTSPDVILTSPKNFFDKQNWFHSSSVLWIPQKTSLAIGQVKNRIH